MQLSPPFALDGVVLAIPFLGVARAGFPSPATDYIEQAVSLDKLIIQHPSSTYLCRIEGDNFKEYGLTTGDWAVVDRSLEVQLNRTAVISYQGELMVCRTVPGTFSKLMFQSGTRFYASSSVWDEDRVQLWGIVTHVVKKLL